MIDQILNNPLLFWLFIAFALTVVIQLAYFWVYFSRLAFYKMPASSGFTPPVSVVLTASNQYSDLKQNLPYFLTQDYPDFEVVVVIDNSDDDTDELLKDFSRQYENLHIVELKQKLNWFSGRKFALSLGIKSAKYPTILLSDPTCRPGSKFWITEMAAGFEADHEIVLGYSSFKTDSKINKWLRFTAFYDALFYFSKSLAGIPFKGIGKNLGYSRELFYRHKGFSSHYAIHVGDDELFVNRAANRKNTAVKIHPNACINQIKRVSLSGWLKQEATRLRIRKMFRFKDKFSIRIFSSSSFLFFALFVVLLVLKAPIVPVLVFLFLRFISQMIVLSLAMRKLSEKKLLLLAPVFEILLIITDFLIWIYILIGPRPKWSN
jgi:glycosyltransferase involved in cell wall biosynthesis